MLHVVFLVWCFLAGLRCQSKTCWWVHFTWSSQFMCSKHWDPNRQGHERSRGQFRRGILYEIYEAFDQADE